MNEREAYFKAKFDTRVYLNEQKKKRELDYKSFLIKARAAAAKQLKTQPELLEQLHSCFTNNLFEVSFYYKNPLYTGRFVVNVIYNRSTKKGLLIPSYE